MILFIIKATILDKVSKILTASGAERGRFFLKKSTAINIYEFCCCFPEKSGKTIEFKSI